MDGGKLHCRRVALILNHRCPLKECLAREMHRTESIDYGIVLSGEIDLILDNETLHLKQGDIVVQRGTYHAWSNRSGRPCRMAFVLVSGRFSEDLAAKIK